MVTRTIDTSAKLVTVVFDPANLSESTIVAAIEKAGYQSEKID